MDIDADNKAKESSSKTVNKEHITREKTDSFDRTNDTAYPKGPTFTSSGDQVIKVEDELQLTDEDEEALLAVASTSNKVICKTTPIKLKKIKHEPKTRFSEIDVVNLSDNEDGIFPYSQLFDIKFEDKVKQEVEIKQEYISNDTEKVESTDMNDEVIVLTDSEDDDNPWLQRLSRSQLFNENKDELIEKGQEDKVASIVKEEVDLGTWQEDDVSKMIQDTIPSTSKDLNEMADVGISEESVRKEIPRERTTTSTADDNNTNLLAAGMSEMDVDNADLSNEPNSESIDHAAKQKTDAKQSAESHKQTETSSNNTSPLTSAKHKSRLAIATKRAIPLIEPPYLPSSRRGRPKSRDLRGDFSKDSNKDRSSKASKIPGNEEKLSSNSAAEEKTQRLKEKMDDHFYNKDQRQGKGSSRGSPDNTSSSKSSISKKEKKIIAEERKAKLKKIAEETRPENNKNIKRGPGKPRVKITLKNRGDFLCNEQEVRAPKPSTSKSAERTKPSNDKGNRATSAREAESAVTESMIDDVEARKSQREDAFKNAADNVAPTLKHQSVEDRSDVTAATVSELPDKSEECSSALKNNHSVKLTKTKKNKNVCFSGEVDIREYEIESENTLKKLIGKDAPIPTDKLVRTEKTHPEWSPKLEEYLLRIFMWNPVWLEEQRYLRSEPPIVPQDELQPLKVRYDSFRHYYDVVLPVMLLETWHTINKEFEMIERNARHVTAMCSIVANSITHVPIPATNLFLTNLMLEVLVTREDLVRQNHPTLGDLVSFEYVMYANGRQTFHKVFAYIIHKHESVITEFTRYNEDLRQYVSNPYQVITYNIQTRPIECNILLNRVHRVRTVMYLRANMRMVQALQYFPQSPLSELILRPNVHEYQLPPLNSSLTCNSLITEDKLNQKQLEAVFRVTDAVMKKQAKLCLIQGPPGTGKSKVIVNLVAQILYGEREHSNASEKNKILLCAPSNAAIDEIVTRLLVIRSYLKQKYNYTFNLVRFGRPEHMHPLAKNISAPELARRHLRKFTESVVCWSSNSTTNRMSEKTKLERQIDLLQATLRNPASLSEARRREIKRKLTDASSRYELLLTGKLFEEIDQKDRNKFQRPSEDVILAGADIIACTLSSCYTNQMESIFGANREKLSVCIVDEATQSCEAETLIPLMLGVNTLVLVGDPNQLPATILSQRAKKLGLDQSIFSRMQRAFTSQTNNPIIMLDTQYRMAYSISYWPNRYFYDCKLKNATELRISFPFHPYRVLSHNSVQNNDRFSNTTEAEFVSNMIYAMLIYAKWEDTNEPVTLGVLTPYNNQRTVVLNKINEKISNLPENMRKKIAYEVNTVDSFQGQERDIIIMSCVRSHGIGFMSDKQRLCVALTRAKHSLILCGNFNTFMKDQMWNSLLSDARSRGVLCNVDANATSTIIKPFIVK
ncbi:Probable helicase senataxin [Harpegnathos saltator]|uniref:Probable helicase senataxin n=2 Tax=Harpegnathos saltator TaxID=610380 RepID=E2C4Q6_HARSA|nr:Probable helicase senataxin [Harpegnathos saltator]